jgi:hypothetical protein
VTVDPKTPDAKPVWAEWSWHVDVLPWQGCAYCFQPLRTHSGAGVVKWRDGKLYATGCLLDKLAAVPPIMKF